MEETISLKELFDTLKKRIWIILLIAIIPVIISTVLSFYVITPIYKTSTQILVNQNNGDQQTTSGDIRTNLELINTYNVIIKSPAILDKVVEELDLTSSVGKLNSQINVQSEKNSQVVSIAVEDPNPEMAVKIANTTAEVFQREIVKIMNVNNVSILAYADFDENPSPIKPQPLLNIAIALVVGLMIGVGVAFLLEYLDNSIKSEQDVENILGLPVLGVITTMEKEEKLKRNQMHKVDVVRGESVGS
ncbi:YveK family protein [Bacillus solimangrovi]|uniref:Capsular biosynthesis protein n=1 Tax=Bacillus solimangrovi TaxID=1305675 RepID=A0A1E5LDI7_9BACI|nr:Wzz/FepE/Etk N-terminal domain-containing protein [Bacillus solimangrovi]OEH92134.1 capsular biosynthesis protein [Bacillus solimangrovi]